jgi:hypothetical protein
MPSEGASILTAKRMAFSYFGENLTMSKNKKKGTDEKVPIEL